MTQISERIHYVGVNDRGKELFEGLWPLPQGISYNSYLVVDEKVALIDTVEVGFEEEFLSNIQETLESAHGARQERQIDYLVVNHMEPDHSSLVRSVMEKYPLMQVLACAKAVPMLRGYYGVPEERITVMSEGSSVSLGGCCLRFYMTPMIHWPETMMTWLPEEGTLFSGDAFGTFKAVDRNPIDKEGTFDEYRKEMIRYYSNIVGKYGTPVQSALKKLRDLEIKRICSTHGPVWETEIPQVIDLYDRLSRYEAERGVCIVYGSMYGNTAAAAEALARELDIRRIPYAIHNLTATGLTLSAALRDAFIYNTIVVGSPTYNNGIFPPVEAFMKALQGRLVRERRFFAFGSFTWSGASVNLLNQMAENMGYEILGQGLSFPQAYAREKCDMSAVADLLG